MQSHFRFQAVLIQFFLKSETDFNALSSFFWNLLQILGLQAEI